MNLKKLGWNQYFNDKLNEFNIKEDYKVARVAVEYKNSYKLFLDSDEMLGQISGKMHYARRFPVVGDWVLVSLISDDRAIIHEILPRKSKFSRKTAGGVTEEQIVAANIDTIFLVSSLNQDFNLRRIERYLTIAWDSGAKPVIILSKADLSEDNEVKKAEVQEIAYGVPVHLISSLTGEGIEELDEYLIEGSTSALLGSSGVGKSTLINKILGEEKLKTNEIRSYDGKGKHTTTNRELIILPGGGVIIDTPGMKEIQLWDGSEGLNESFKDIETLAQNCHFNDCQHDSEPKCAVKKAIKDGVMTKERLESYRKLQRELKYMEIKKERGARAVEKYK